VNPPSVLPPAVSEFLTRTCGLHLSEVEKAWDVMKADIWQEDDVMKVIMDSEAREAVFRQLGLDLGLGMVYIHSV
jgi:hypothetical protein